MNDVVSSKGLPMGPSAARRQRLAVLSLLLLAHASTSHSFSMVPQDVWNKEGRLPRNSKCKVLPSRPCETTSLGTTVADNDTSSSSSNPLSTVPPETSPLPLHTFSGIVEQALREQFFPIDDLERRPPRVIESWRLLERGYEHHEFVGVTRFGRNADTSRCRQHCHSYVPGLTVREFWDPSEFEWCHKLQSKYAAILREFQAVTSDLESLQRRGNNVWAGALTEDASSYGEGWKTLVLMDRGHWDPINVNLFPATARAVYNSGVPAVEVFFASMQPHTTIQPHSDFTNFVLTSHLPLVVPYSGQNQCRLTIGDETREWIDGKLMVFDTSLVHDAANDSDQTRFILMLRLWHPDLSPQERAALQFTYDCLELPELLSNDPEERRIAQQKAEAMRAFPELHKGKAVKQGFGGKSVPRSGSSKKRKAG